MCCFLSRRLAGCRVLPLEIGPTCTWASSRVRDLFSLNNVKERVNGLLNPLEELCCPSLPQIMYRHSPLIFFFRLGGRWSTCAGCVRLCARRRRSGGTRLGASSSPSRGPRSPYSAPRDGARRPRSTPSYGKRRILFGSTTWEYVLRI